MATLYVEGYSSTVTTNSGNPIPLGGIKQRMKVNIASAANAGTALNSFIKYVVLTADTACQWEIGENPTATAGSTYLPGNVPRYFAVKSGHKISVVEQK